jgi:hypothetical protein
MRTFTIVSLLVLVGCASAPAPEPPELLVPSSPEAAVEPELALAPPREAVAAPRESRAPTGDSAPAADPTVVVIEAGGSSDQAGNLAAASRAAKAQRAAELPRPGTITITDKNLKEFATGELTEASAKPVPSTPAAATPGGHPEAWWRQQVRERRERWAALVDEILDLEGRTEELRRRFYAESDPWYRDSRIKPEWDRALDRLVAARDEARLAEREVASFLELGRQENVYPGWLREGVEREPVERPYEVVAPGTPRAVGEPIEATRIVGEPKTIDE